MGQADFAVRAISHASSFPQGYDPQRHQYDPAHLTPTHWTAVLRLALADERKSLGEQLEKTEEPVSVTYVDSHGVPHARDHGDVQRERDEREAEGEELNAALAEMNDMLGRHTFRYTVSRLVQRPLERWVHLTDQFNQPVISGQTLQGMFDLNTPGLYRFELEMVRKADGVVVETHSKDLHVRELYICSIGDSYACGEGNPDRNTSQDFSGLAELNALDTLYMMRGFMGAGITPNVDAAQWQEGLAHRSLNCAPANSARQLGGSFDVDGPCVTFVNLARSGALINKGLIGVGRTFPRMLPLVQFVQRGEEARAAAGRNWAPARPGTSLTEIVIAEPVMEMHEGQLRNAPGNLDSLLNMGQLDELDTLTKAAAKHATDLGISRWMQPRRPDFLSIVAGGNDVHWINGFVDIMTPGNAGLYDVKEFVSSAIRNSLPSDFRKLNERIATLAAQPRFVLITGYPGGFFGVSGGLNSECGVFDALDWFVEITKTDASVIHDLARALNDMLKSLVRELNEENTLWNTNHPQQKRDFMYAFVEGVEGPFSTHGYCATIPYFVGAGESVRRQGDFLGLLHPNSSGHHEIGVAMANTMRKLMSDYPQAFDH